MKWPLRLHRGLNSEEPRVRVPRLFSLVCSRLSLIGLGFPITASEYREEDECATGANVPQKESSGAWTRTFLLEQGNQRLQTPRCSFRRVVNAWRIRAFQKNRPRRLLSGRDPQFCQFGGYQVGLLGGLAHSLCHFVSLLVLSTRKRRNPGRQEMWASACPVGAKVLARSPAHYAR